MTGSQWNWKLGDVRIRSTCLSKVWCHQQRLLWRKPSWSSCSVFFSQNTLYSFYCLLTECLCPYYILHNVFWNRDWTLQQCWCVCTASDGFKRLKQHYVIFWIYKLTAILSVHQCMWKVVDLSGLGMHPQKAQIAETYAAVLGGKHLPRFTFIFFKRFQNLPYHYWEDLCSS